MSALHPQTTIRFCPFCAASKRKGNLYHRGNGLMTCRNCGKSFKALNPKLSTPSQRNGNS